MRSSTWLHTLLLVSLAAFASAAHAATYYVRSDGNDARDGLSHENAWRTLAKVNAHNFKTGDRVLFLEGQTFEGQLIVDWSGTADTPVIIGAYRLDAGIPVRGFRTARPVIDGADRIPAQYDGLIRVRRDYVHIEDLSVVNSEGRAIQFEDAAFGVVADCETSNSYKSGIKFIRSHNALIQGNVVRRAGTAFPEENGVWGGAIELVASNDGVIRNNRVLEVYGEGINANHGSARALIEGNFVYAARAVGIYIDAAPAATVRRNMVLGTAHEEFWRTERSVGAGIALNNEAYHYAARDGDLPELAPSVQARGARIYGNLVAATSSGIAFWGQFDSSTFDETFVFNNTLVDNDTQLTLGEKSKPGGKLLNNVLLSLSPGTRDVDRPHTSGMTAKANYLSKGNPGGDFSAAGNFHSGLALERMSSWRAIRSPSDVGWRDFAIARGSTLIGRGDGEPLKLSQTDNSFGMDFNGLPHNAAIDVGALHYTEAPVTTPSKPPRPSARP